MLRQASRIDNHNREISWLQYFVQLEHTEYFFICLTPWLSQRDLTGLYHQNKNSDSCY